MTLAQELTDAKNDEEWAVVLAKLRADLAILTESPVNTSADRHPHVPPCIECGNPGVFGFGPFPHRRFCAACLPGLSDEERALFSKAAQPQD
jgi:hypothetical protein